MGDQPPNPPIGGLKESYWFLSPPDGGFRGLINNGGFRELINNAD
jgi:hypothetical protein